MKVLLCAPHYAPFFEGGTEAVVRASARALRKLGHDVLVVAGHDQVLERSEWPGELYQSGVQVDGYPVHFVPRLATPVGDLAAAIDDALLLHRPLALELVIQLAERFQPDVVHVHHHGFLSSGLVRGLAQEGFPVALSLHDLFVSCPRFFRTPVGAMAAMGCPPLERASDCTPCLAQDAGGAGPDALAAALVDRRETFRKELESAGLLLAPSSYHGRSIEQLFGLDTGQVRTMANGLVRELRRTTHAGPRLETETLHIFHHGHRAPVKGTLDLVRAMALAAAETGVPMALTLAGAEVEHGFDDELSAAAGAVELRFTGTFAGPELPTLAQGAHLAAYPSRAPESYGLVVDEALAMGLPALVSDGGALPERIAPSTPGAPAFGAVLPTGDVAAWAAQIADLARDPRLTTRWRAAIPGNMRGPSEAAAELVGLYRATLLP
ncbi:MAG: glycosyltransferase [Planctomycetota bacterium]|nr:glycosyltransferase [Planctomycetota bacterium]